jgi:hypothetical protein
VNGRSRETGSFVDNPNLASLATPSGRFDYYRGHRAGSEEASLAASNGRMGIDSFTVLALYLLGVAGLIAVATG